MIYFGLVHKNTVGILPVDREVTLLSMHSKDYCSITYVLASGQPHFSRICICVFGKDTAKVGHYISIFESCSYYTFELRSATQNDIFEIVYLFLCSSVSAYNMIC